MANNDDFNLDEFNEQMRRNQEMDKWRMMQEQTDALNKLSGNQPASSGVGWKGYLIMFAIGIPIFIWVMSDILKNS